MKNLLILLILFAAFLTSCQTKAENIAKDLNANYFENIKKTEETQPLIPPTPTPKSFGSIDSKIGIVEIRSNQTSCLRTKNGNLAKDTLVTIITSLNEKPQKILTATIEKKLEKSCGRRFSESGDSNPSEDYFYSLNLNENTRDEIDYDVGIAVISPAKPIQIQDKLASIDLNDDGKADFFRRCASFEGIHFTIWTGKPLIGKRIWHYYYYLDYDTDPNCKKKDWEGTED